MALRLRIVFALMLVIMLASVTPTAQTTNVPDLPAMTPTGPGFDRPVYTAAEFGDHIYLGGEYTYATEANAGLFAYDPATTKVYDTDLAPLDGSVEAFIPDGAGGYFVGGDFGYLNGTNRPYLSHVGADGSLNTAWQPQIAAAVTALAFDGARVYAATWANPNLPNANQVRLTAYDPETGAIIWEHAPNGRIESLAVADGTLYLGGSFGAINGISGYTGVAAMTAATGEMLPWKPQFHGLQIETIAVSADTVFVGGRFGLVAFDRTIGARLPWNPQPDSIVYQLEIIDDQLWVFGYFSTIGGAPRNSLAVFGLADLTLTATALPPLPGPVCFFCGMVVHNEAVTVLVDNPTTNLREARANELITVQLATGELQRGPRVLHRFGNPVLLGSLNDQVMLSGSDVGVGGGLRAGLTRIDRVTGALDDWQPPEEVQAIAKVFAGPDQLYLIGKFSDLDKYNFYLRPLDPVSNTFGSWAVLTLAHPVPMVLVGDELLHANIVPRYRPSGEPNLDPYAEMYGIVATNMYTGESRYWGQAAFSGDTSEWVDTLEVAHGRLYAAGRFTAVSFTATDGDAPRERSYLAAFDLATGELLPWKPEITLDSQVRPPQAWGLASSGNMLYVSGYFDAVNGQQRSNFAAFNLDDGSLLPWQTDPIRHGYDLRYFGNYLYAYVNAYIESGQVHRVIALDPENGVRVPHWQLDLPGNAGLYGLLVTDTGLLAYGEYASIAGSVQSNSAFFPFTQTSPEPTATPTATPEPTATSTPTPTTTPEPTPTPSPSPSPSPTNEPAPTEAEFRVFLPMLVGN